MTERRAWRRKIAVFLAGLLLLPLLCGLAQGQEKEGGVRHGATSTWNPLRYYVVDLLTGWFPNLELRGAILHESDLRLHKNSDEPLGAPLPCQYRGRPCNRHHDPKAQRWSRIENIFELRYKYHLAPSLTLIGQLDMLYDASFDWQAEARGRNGPAERELEYFRTFRRIFREGYLHWRGSTWEMRLGKQQVVWGKATDVGHFVDQVHGFDFRELHDTGLDDTELTRRTQWMANLQYFWHDSPLGDLDLQLLWIPDYEEDLYGPPDWPQSPFFLVRQTPGFKASRFLKTDKPSASFQNHDWGLRISTLTEEKWDLQLYFLGFYNRSPFPFIRGIDEAKLAQDRAADLTPSRYILIEPKPTRIWMLGGSLEKTYTFGTDNDWIFRGELAYFLNRYVSTVSRTKSPSLFLKAIQKGFSGLAKRNEMRYALNAETNVRPPFFSGPADWLLSLWYAGYVQFGHDNDFRVMGGALKKWKHLGIFYFTKAFWNDKAVFSAAVAYDANEGSWRFLDSLSYEVNDAVKVKAGYTGFSGNRNDPWGWGDREFDEIQFEVEYNF